MLTIPDIKKSADIVENIILELITIVSFLQKTNQTRIYVFSSAFDCIICCELTNYGSVHLLVHGESYIIFNHKIFKARTEINHITYKKDDDPYVWADTNCSTLTCHERLYYDFSWDLDGKFELIDIEKGDCEGFLFQDSLVLEERRYNARLFLSEWSRRGLYNIQIRLDNPLIFSTKIYESLLELKVEHKIE